MANRINYLMRTQSGVTFTLLIFSLLIAGCNSVNTGIIQAENIVQSVKEKKVIQSNPADIKLANRTMDYLGISLLLPSEFEGMHLCSRIIDTEECELIQETSADSPPIKINVLLTPVDESRAKQSYRNLSRQQKLEFVFDRNKGESTNSDVIYYQKNGIKGYLSKVKTSNGKFSLEWKTFRYFETHDPDAEIQRNEIQKFRLEIFGNEEYLPQMMQIIDSLRFLQDEKDYLAIK